MWRALHIRLSPAVILICGLLNSCTDTPEDCPSPLCIISGGWRLTEIQLDGETYSGSLEHFELILYAPSQDNESTSTFNRTGITGIHDSGNWSVENINPGSSSFNGGILRLVPNGDPDLREDWKIEMLTPRLLILVLERDVTAKEGPALIRFVLEPF